MEKIDLPHERRYMIKIFLGIKLLEKAIFALAIALFIIMVIKGDK